MYENKTDQTELLLKILRELQKVNALNDIVLIGSWCKIFYRQIFDTDEISILRTSDIDFCVKQNLKTKNNVDIDSMLIGLGFDQDFHNDGLIKYAHPDLEVQFITNEIGKGKIPNVYDIDAYHIKAEGIRFVDILLENTITHKFEDIVIKLPNPEIFVLQKILICDQRIDLSKKEKDITSASEIASLCFKDSNRRECMKNLLNKLPKKWQARIKEKVFSEPDLQHIKIIFD